MSGEDLRRDALISRLGRALAWRAYAEHERERYLARASDLVDELEVAAADARELAELVELLSIEP